MQSPMRMRFAITVSLVAISGWSCSASPAEADRPQQNNEFGALEYRLLGPPVGGRITAVAGVPGDPQVFYASAAQGRLWKTGNGGLDWTPLFDAGQTWRHVSKARGQIGQMIVHPRNPDVAYAAVLGSPFGPSETRGVYRTTDGAATWEQVRFKNADTGASDVAFDPGNPHILFAGLWQTPRQPWQMTSGGSGSGLYRSSDGGATWVQLTGNGLPEGDWGKMGVAVAPSDSRRVYALIEAEGGGLFRSDDGGENWQRVNDHRILRQRHWYHTVMTIDPANADMIWLPQAPLLKSIDGGKTVSQIKGPHHGDHHDVWIGPKIPGRIITGTDGGVDISLDRKLSSVVRPPKYFADDPDEPSKEPKPELTKTPGFNRIVWDMRMQGGKRVPSKLDGGNPEIGPLALPGRYDLRLLGDDIDASGSLEILPGPRSPVSCADLEANVDYSLSAVDALDRTADRIHTLIAIREQVGELIQRIEDRSELADLEAAAERVLVSSGSLEQRLHNPEAQVAYDILAGRDGGAKLYSQLSWVYLLNQSSDYAPAQGLQERLQALVAELAAIEADYARLYDSELARFEQLAAAAGLPQVILPLAP